MRSHYDVLQVRPDATPEEIKAAFRSAALTLHPDKHRAAQGAATKEFLELQRAYHVLRDAHLRKIHDQELQLHSMRQCFSFQDELHVRDMEPVEHEGVHGFEHLCRCGGTYWLPRSDIAGAMQSVVLPCFTCSNHVLVDVTGMDVEPPAAPGEQPQQQSDDASASAGS